MVDELLPGFRQFRFPAKLFTFTALGLAVLAGVGWDRVFTGRARGARVLFFVLLVVTLAVLAGVVMGAGSDSRIVSYTQEPIDHGARSIPMADTR